MSSDVGPEVVVAVAATIVGWSLTSRRLGSLGVTAPLMLVAVGFALGGIGPMELPVRSDTLRHVAEAALVLLVFADASRVEVRVVRGDGGLWLRLLALGVPLALGFGLIAALVSYPGIELAVAALVVAALTPTDAGLAAEVIRNPAVPPRVARALNIESGVNDGLVAPLVVLAVAAVAQTESHDGGFVLSAAGELLRGALCGAAIGAVGSVLVRAAARRGWADPDSHFLVALGVAVAAYGTALAVHGNGFVAAFLAGVCFGPAGRRLTADAFRFTEHVGQLLGSVVWFALGAALLPDALSHLEWRTIVFAVLMLTVVRMAAVAISMLGSGDDGATTSFIGWFGPRGLASLVFGLLALDALGEPGEPVMAAISITVTISVVAHGLSASGLIARYRRYLDGHASPPAEPGPAPDATSEGTGATRAPLGGPQR